MSEHALLENGTVVDADDGTIIDAADVNDTLKFAVSRRHELKRQEDAHAAARAVYDAVIKKNQANGKVAYGDLVCAVKSSTYHKFDVDEFREFLDELEMTQDELVALVMAATAFDRALLPVSVLDAYDDANKTLGRKPWVETTVALRPAPVLRRIDGPVEGLEESLAMLGARE